MPHLDSWAATDAITGKVQTLFDGSDTIKDFHLAWLEPNLVSDKRPDRPVTEKLAAKYWPLNYCDLIGDQATVWGTP